MTEVSEPASEFVAAELRRDRTGTAARAFRLLAIAAAAYQLYLALSGIKQPLPQYATHMSLLLALGFLSVPSSRPTASRRVGPVYWILSVSALGVGAHYVLDATRIERRLPYVDPVTPGDVVAGAVATLLILEACRRLVGMPLLVVAVVSMAYVWLGAALPGPLWHPRYTVPQLVEHFFLTPEGVLSAPVAASATYVFLFILFGAFLEQSGAGSFFVKFALALAGRARGGAAQVSIVSSALFGTVSGSPVANVVADGPFTIPLMVRVGYTPTFAAAVEAVASTGGAIAPPVMGVAAFLMAEITQIPYAQIAISATLPALLYFVSVAAMVHLEAVKRNLRRLSEREVPPLRQTLREGVQFAVPILALVALLASGQTPVKAAVFAIALCIAASWMRKETRMGPRRILQACERAAETAPVVLAACAAAGLVLGMVSLTGIAGKAASLVSSGLGEGRFVALIFSMVTCLILGIGMPVSAAYVLTAALAVPAVVSAGVPTLPAHLFAVYFSAVSAITPPVAVAAFAAAGIAGANPMRVGMTAVRLGLVALIIPFFFVYQPALLLQGSPGEVARCVVTSLGGVILLAGALQGWLLARASWGERALLALGGLLLIDGSLTTDLLAIPPAAAVLLIQARQTRRAARRSPSAALP